MRVFVTDGNTRAALAITRSLGREGAQVIVGAEKQPCLASSSRYCAERFLYPDPLKDCRKFTEAIFRTVEKRKPDVLLPVTDITTLLVTENKESLEKHCSVPFPDYESVCRAADKFTLMKMAESLAVPIPQTIYLDDTNDPEVAADRCRSLGYPIVIKPSRSRFRTENGWRGTGVQYATDEKALKKILSASAVKKEGPLLLQERINGDGVGLFLCMDGGVAIAAFSHRRLREKPPSGGVSVLRESIPVDPELRDYSERLLKALNWRGVAMVEFKRDNRTGECKLMEINGRFWGSLQLAIDAGVNFPSLLARMAKEEKIVPLQDYRVGVKTRWLWGDVDVLLARLFKSNRTLNLPLGYPGRMKMLSSFLAFWEKDLHYEVLDRDDMKPWLHETKCWLHGKN